MTVVVGAGMRFESDKCKLMKAANIISTVGFFIGLVFWIYVADRYMSH